MKIYHVQAFSKNNSGGNAAGVVLEGEHLSEVEMQEIAKDLNYSETAFVLESHVADYKVRFFTPSSEVDLCGHATIGTFHILHQIKELPPGTYRQETLAGILSIDIDETGVIYMEQPLPETFGVLDKEAIASSLGIKGEDIIEPIEIVSTGLKDIIIGVKNSEILSSIKPNFDHIKEISKDHKVVGYHVFTMDVKAPYFARCRNFAPLYDIEEEAATGTASGALTAYFIKHHKALSIQLESGSQEWFYEQGCEMNSLSEIGVKFVTDDDALILLKIGGKAHFKEV
jgi:PhzF family phenazine biosynthesis protein